MKGNAAGRRITTESAGNAQGQPKMDGRLGPLALVLAAAAIVLAACGGPSTPSVASLGQSGDTEDAGHTSTTLPTGNATRLLDEWASCMRAHGDPDQADPTIDAHDDIDITWNPAIPGGFDGTDKGGQGNSGPGQYCRSYLTAAQTELGGNRQPARNSQSTLEKYSQCMRANGIPDFPDPTNGTLSFNVGGSTDLNPDAPVFRSASKLCVEKTGAQVPGAGSTPPPGIIRLNGEAPPGSDASAAG